MTSQRIENQAATALNGSLRLRACHSDFLVAICSFLIVFGKGLLGSTAAGSNRNNADFSANEFNSGYRCETGHRDLSVAIFAKLEDARSVINWKESIIPRR
jgi:hypothetical protein